MERRKKVELFEEIRREYEFGVGTIKGVARKLREHRRMVRQALADAQPPARKRAAREWPVLRPLIPLIDGILEADRQAPRNSVTPRIVCGRGLVRRYRSSRWRNRRFAGTCARASKSWGGQAGRPACRSHTNWARRLRSVRGLGGVERRGGDAAARGRGTASPRSCR